MSEGEAQATLYSAHDLAQLVVGDELIALAGIQSGHKVLELGCGTGGLSTKLAQQVGSDGEVLGIDPDEDNIDIARENTTKQGNIKFEASSTTDFRKDGSCSYDVVFSCLVLNWIPNEEKPPTFSRVFECLKPGGHFAIAVAPQLPATWKLVMGLLKPEETREIREHVESRLLCSERLQELAKGAGFEIVSCTHKHTTGMVFREEQMDEFLSHVSCVFRGYADVDAIKTEDIANLDLPRTADGNILVDGHVVFALLRKPDQ